MPLYSFEYFSVFGQKLKSENEFEIWKKKLSIIL